VLDPEGRRFLGDEFTSHPPLPIVRLSRLVDLNLVRQMTPLVTHDEHGHLESNLPVVEFDQHKLDIEALKKLPRALQEPARRIIKIEREILAHQGENRHDSGLIWQVKIKDPTSRRMKPHIDGAGGINVGINMHADAVYTLASSAGTPGIAGEGLILPSFGTPGIDPVDNFMQHNPTAAIIPTAPGILYRHTGLHTSGTSPDHRVLHQVRVAHDLQ
jgi:hypothetical protein